MLYSINRGNTGLPVGSQATIVHLVSTVHAGMNQGRAWAVSDGNAGAVHANFDCTFAAVEALNWTAIRAAQWSGIVHQKQAEFLVHNFFPWSGIVKIGCFNQQCADLVHQALQQSAHVPAIAIERNWYY